MDWTFADSVSNPLKIHNGGDQYVAVKLLASNNNSELVMNNFVQEMEMLMKVGRHVNIVNFIGVVLVGE